MSAHQRLEGAVAHGEAIEVLLSAGSSWSGARLARAAERWAEQLASLGLAPGFRVATFQTNSPLHVALLLGTWRAGGVHVPINPGYQEGELHHVLADSGAEVLVVDGPAEALSRLPDAASLRALATLQPLDALPTLPRLPLAPLEADDGRTPQPLQRRADSDLALLIYTSGTTGRSKGCEHTFAGLEAGVAALSGEWAIGSRDQLVHALPLFHVHGLAVALLACLRRHARVLLLPRFSPEAVVAAVDAGATLFMGVPTMYARLLAHLASHPDDGPRLGRARLFTAGSAALLPADFETFLKHTGHRVLERYGMSETLITLTNELHGERRPGWVGRAVPAIETRVVDDALADLPAMQAGELLVRGPQVMARYWRRPDATDASFAPGGWFRTGDVVERDAQGFIRIVGRASTDILKVGGYKLGAREIEEALASHPALAEVAVVGIPDAEWGQRVIACVVLRAEAPPLDDTALLQALQAHVRLHESKRPRGLLRLERLPRNAMGKVQKTELSRLAEAASKR